MSNMTSLIGILIQEGAPIIASYLGSPIAGVVVAAIAHHYGMASTSSVEDVTSAIQANPIHLKTLEFDHREHLAQYFVDIVNDEPQFKGWMGYVISFLAFLALCAYVYLDYVKG